MDPRRQAQVRLKLFVDVGEAAWNGPGVAVHREGQPHSVARRRIRVLAHDQDPYVVQGLPEGPQHVRRYRQHLVPPGHLRREESQASRSCASTGLNASAQSGATSSDSGSRASCP